jgi:hypothetical protein
MMAHIMMVDVLFTRSISSQILRNGAAIEEILIIMVKAIVQ